MCKKNTIRVKIMIIIQNQKKFIQNHTSVNKINLSIKMYSDFFNLNCIL